LSVSVTIRHIAFKVVCEDVSSTELAEDGTSDQTSGPVLSGLCEIWFSHSVVCKDVTPLKWYKFCTF